MYKLFLKVLLISSILFFYSASYASRVPVTLQNNSPYVVVVVNTFVMGGTEPKPGVALLQPSGQKGNQGVVYVGTGPNDYPNQVFNFTFTDQSGNLHNFNCTVSADVGRVMNLSATINAQGNLLLVKAPFLTNCQS